MYDIIDEVFSIDLDGIKSIDGVIVDNVRFFSDGGDDTGMEIVVIDNAKRSIAFKCFFELMQVEEWTLNVFQTLMKKVKSTVQSLQFDAMTTTFTTDNQRKRKLSEFFSSFSECESVCGPCGNRCGESTLRKTACGHHLCLRCEQKYASVDDFIDVRDKLRAAIDARDKLRAAIDARDKRLNKRDELRAAIDAAR